LWIALLFTLLWTLDNWLLYFRLHPGPKVNFAASVAFFLSVFTSLSWIFSTHATVHSGFWVARLCDVHYILSIVECQFKVVYYWEWIQSSTCCVLYMGLSLLCFVEWIAILVEFMILSPSSFSGKPVDKMLDLNLLN
jgi:hypothetical protein